jgi:hypothetical protein
MILFGNYCGINRLEGVLHRPFEPALTFVHSLTLAGSPFTVLCTFCGCIFFKLTGLAAGQKGHENAPVRQQSFPQCSASPFC